MSEWISVKDKVPEYNQEILAALGYAYYICLYDGIFMTSEAGDWVEIEPTHWLPLPELPIEEVNIK